MPKHEQAVITNKRKCMEGEIVALQLTGDLNAK
jgi:hypothetical protein